jgi:hypothetical protein
MIEAYQIGVALTLETNAGGVLPKVLETFEKLDKVVKDTASDIAAVGVAAAIGGQGLERTPPPPSGERTKTPPAVRPRVPQNFGKNPVPNPLRVENRIGGSPKNCRLNANLLLVKDWRPTISNRCSG